jgi:hypothetical protein
MRPASLTVLAISGLGPPGVKMDGEPPKSTAHVTCRTALTGKILLLIHKDAIVITGAAMNTGTDMECD